MATPQYNVFSVTYSTAKAAWNEGKNYKGISTVEGIAETSVKAVLSIVDRFVMRTGDLNAVDQKVTSGINAVDER